MGGHQLEENINTNYCFIKNGVTITTQLIETFYMLGNF